MAVEHVYQATSWRPLPMHPKPSQKGYPRRTPGHRRVRTFRCAPSMLSRYIYRQSTLRAQKSRRKWNLWSSEASLKSQVISLVFAPERPLIRLFFSQNQPLLATSLQTAHNLRVLPDLVQNLVSDLSTAVEARIKSAFDISQISKELNPKGDHSRCLRYFPS